MAKPTGPLCNLGCEYCFYRDKEDTLPQHNRWRMTPQVLEGYIRQRIHGHSGPVVTFAWQGGEPSLLGIEFFRDAVELQRKYANGKGIENTFQTNGVLLNDEWCEFFARNEFLVGISIDGPREIHDRYRVDRNGRPTFDGVARAIHLLKKHGVAFNALTVVQRDNGRRPLEVYHFLKEIGARHIQFIPCVERVLNEDGARLAGYDCASLAECKLSNWSVDPIQFGRFMCTIFNEWVRGDVGQVYVQLFDACLQAWCGMEPGLCTFAKTCGNAVALEHNGDIYSCDHFVYREYKLGNILETELSQLVRSEKQREFGTSKRNLLTSYCRQCDFLSLCNGDCPKHRFTKTPEGEDGLSYLCSGYQMFFHHVAPYMNFMAEQLAQRRPPSLVVQWSQRRDVRISKLNRNDLCICGSGLKVKKCCGRNV